MADDLADRCANLNISDEENEIVDLGRVGSEITNVKTSLMLVGKVITERAVNLEALRRTMSQIWALHRNMVVRAIGMNTFVFQFFHWKDKEKIMAGRPWCFDQKLLVIDAIQGDEQPSQVNLDTSPFWVRIYNLPFNCRTEAEVRAIASCLGPVMEIDVDDFGLERFCRVKVLLNVLKPLRRKQRIKRKDGMVVTIEYKYERLPHFCFSCGVPGHSDKDCNVETQEDGDIELGWGVWLKASPFKGKTKHKEEELAIKARRKVLFVPKEEKRSSGGSLPREKGKRDLLRGGNEDARGVGDRLLGDGGETFEGGAGVSTQIEAGMQSVGENRIAEASGEREGIFAPPEGDTSINDEKKGGHSNDEAEDGGKVWDTLHGNQEFPIMPNNVAGGVGSTSNIPLFQVGSHTTNGKIMRGKKKTHARRKTSDMPAQGHYHVTSASQETSVQVAVDFYDDMEMGDLINGKRKADIMDLGEEGDKIVGDRKKTKCAQVQSQMSNPVAEVGVSQPREQQ